VPAVRQQTIQLFFFSSTYPSLKHEVLNERTIPKWRRHRNLSKLGNTGSRRWIFMNLNLNDLLLTDLLLLLWLSSFSLPGRPGQEMTEKMQTSGTDELGMVNVIDVGLKRTYWDYQRGYILFFSTQYTLIVYSNTAGFILHRRRLLTTSVARAHCSLPLSFCPLLSFLFSSLFPLIFFYSHFFLVRLRNLDST